MGRTGDRLTAGRKQVTVVTRSEHVQAGGKGPGRQGPRREEAEARAEVTGQVCWRGAGEPRGLEKGPQGAWGAGRRRGPTLISGAALNCGGPFSRLPAALASLKLGVGELGGFTGSGTRRLGAPALFPEPGATPPAPAGAVALGSFLQRGADGRRLRRRSQVGRTGRLSGWESHRGSAPSGAGRGDAVRTGALLGNVNPQEASSAVASAGGCGNAHPEPGEAPGVSPRPPQERSTHSGCSARRSPRGRGAALRPGGVRRRGGQGPALGEVDADLPMELGPGAGHSQGEAEHPAVWGPGNSPARTGASGEGPLAQTGMCLHPGAMAVPKAARPSGHSRGAGRRVVGAGRRAQGLATRAATRCAVERRLRRAVCHHRAVTWRARGVNGSLQCSPPRSPPPPPLTGGAVLLATASASAAVAPTTSAAASRPRLGAGGPGLGAAGPTGGWRGHSLGVGGRGARTVAGRRAGLGTQGARGGSCSRGAVAARGSAQGRGGRWGAGRVAGRHSRGLRVLAAVDGLGAVFGWRLRVGGKRGSGPREPPAHPPPNKAHPC